ncbi:hypothetical protein [Lacrimispora celerecrescens]|uniref:hypothetical protein n=1 Tax=Lacrimispora celerecrescens TaxID=29354 RepID=UPI0016497E2F|nr:hypothetical protein [Lacrimispora celerecrescens]
MIYFKKFDISYNNYIKGGRIMFEIIMEARRAVCFRPVRIPLQFTDKGRGYG